jgi:hypothetical protein
MLETGENREQFLFWLDGDYGCSDIVRMPNGFNSERHVDVPDRDRMGFVSAYVVFDTARL